MMTHTLYNSSIPHLDLIHRGKVRDLYKLDANRMLMVATDRLSAFDVILPDAIPSKGEALTQLALFWFKQTQALIKNHLTGDKIIQHLSSIDTNAYIYRSMIVRRLRPLPIEAVVRGYLMGNAWKEYQKCAGKICGIQIPAGLQLAEQLPTPIFTPSRKAPLGQHDENITFDQFTELVGGDLAEQIRHISIKLYQHASEIAMQKGIIIADTKFEFGLDEHNQLILMDEIFTPDSSRFWSKEHYQIGVSPPSFDKQFIRDYLLSQRWNPSNPPPRLPPEVILETTSRYIQALNQLTSITLN